MEFTLDALANGRRFRILTLVDEFTRECLTVEVDFSLSGIRIARALDRLIAERCHRQRQWPRVHVHRVGSVGGIAKGSPAFHQAGRPMEDACIWSFNGPHRDECLNLHWFIDLSNAREKA